MSDAPIIAVVGPSGVGKDSVMSALAARAGFRLVRRVITRAPEAGGEDYDAVSELGFQRREAEGAFVLSWQAHGLQYGIPQDQIADRSAPALINLSRSVLLDAQERLAPFIVLSLTARPEVLAQRLATRGREDAEDQARRLGRVATLPDGLSGVLEIDNSGSLEDTVRVILSRLQPESA